MKNIMKAAVCLAFGIFVLCGTVFGAIKMYWGRPYAEVDSKRVYLSGEVLRLNRTTYVPVDDVLTMAGYTLGWDSEINAVTACKGGVVSYIILDSPVLWKGPQQYISGGSTMIYMGIFYMPLDMFEYLTGTTVSVSDFGAEEKYMKRDLLIDVHVTDEYRIYGEVERYNSVSIVGNVGMMTEIPTASEVANYANAVNLIANTAPVGVNIYNIVVPTSGEFYGPEGVYMNQTAYIQDLYGRLSERIIPINAVSALNDHAGEYIYFKTDHHYTQRGAYYVYKEFAYVKGETPPILSDFEVNYSYFSGSLVDFAKDTPGEWIMAANPDILERFMPFHYIDGACYADMRMTMPISHLEAVYPDTNSYVSFIGGDTPFAVFTTDINNGKKLLILKESFGNAFATWALNNYSEVYVVDVREFNRGGESFKLNDFYKFVKFDDIVIINSVSSLGIYTDLQNLV